jgi:hypothetical protein
MRKIPTLFRRDPENLSRVLPEVNPACQWVIDGEGAATRKYDGTCVMFDGDRWWARREVKPGKTPPPGYVAEETDPNTGKTVGWEPMEQSSFAKFHAEAVEPLLGFGEIIGAKVPAGTYELVGPKINGNPERCKFHRLERHDNAEQLGDVPSDFVGLREYVGWLGEDGIEGIVWHHPDGRMAKLKVRDFPKAA